MCTTKIYKTLVKAGEKLSGNDYVRGRISGIISGVVNLIDGDDHGKLFANIRKDDGSCILRTECSEAAYRKITEIVENHYANLCIFDY